MSRRLGVVMDPIANIKPSKDTSLALMLAAQARGWQIDYFELGDLWLHNGQPMGRARQLRVTDDTQHWYDFIGEEVLSLEDLDAVLIRKDPPFNNEYVYATYILERAQAAGVQVVNDPQALRDVNEKMYTAWFSEFCPPTLITRSRRQWDAFRAEHGEVIAKPLDGMGGASIFRLGAADPNAGVVYETLTQHGQRYALLQRYLPAIAEGDKRVLLVDGEPMDHVLARIPKDGESRGNLAAGGRGVVMPISEREREIAAQLAPKLRDMGLLFVGLDVIGGQLTEINVTSPTCVREIERETDLRIAERLIQAIESRLS